MGLFERRHREQQARVLEAIGWLRPEWATGFRIANLARLDSGRVYVILAQLEGAGTVTSEWGDEVAPGLRRRLYSVARDEARS